MSRRRSDDAGESLIEIMLTIFILGVCAVAIGAGITLSVKISGVHRKQALAGEFLHNYAESLQNSYRTCTGGVPPNYVSIGGLTAPNASFSAPTATIKFWDPNPAGGGTPSFDTNVCPSTDPGLQQVTLTLKSADGFANESLVVILRAPL